MGEGTDGDSPIDGKVVELIERAMDLRNECMNGWRDGWMDT